MLYKYTLHMVFQKPWKQFYENKLEILQKFQFLIWVLTRISNKTLEFFSQQIFKFLLIYREYEKNIETVRKKLSKKRSKRQTPLERGWTSKGFLGRHFGYPEYDIPDGKIFIYLS